METIGTFLGKWLIGKKIPGGVLLHLDAMVTESSPKSSVESHSSG
jgi:hypothetical protein